MVCFHSFHSCIILSEYNSGIQCDTQVNFHMFVFNNQRELGNISAVPRLGGSKFLIDTFNLPTVSFNDNINVKCPSEINGSDVYYILVEIYDNNGNLIESCNGSEVSFTKCGNGRLEDGEECDNIVPGNDRCVGCKCDAGTISIAGMCCELGEVCHINNSNSGYVITDDTIIPLLLNVSGNLTLNMVIYRRGGSVYVSGNIVFNGNVTYDAEYATNNTGTFIIARSPNAFVYPKFLSIRVPEYLEITPTGNSIGGYKLLVDIVYNPPPTDPPTASPTNSPTTSPTNSPTTSPTNSLTTSPTISPTNSSNITLLPTSPTNSSNTTLPPGGENKIIKSIFEVIVALCITVSFVIVIMIAHTRYTQRKA